MLAAAVIGFAVAVVTFVAVDRFMQPELVVGPLEARELTLEIAGGVATPGIVTVPDSSRLQQAVDAAGGLAPNADVSALNMAGRVSDGEQIVIPVIEPDVAAVPSSSAASGSTGDETPADAPTAPGDAPLAAPNAPVNVNTASQAELEALPRIGAVLAGRIIAYRTENGPFTSVDELAEIDGISMSTLEELRPLITVDD